MVVFRAENDENCVHVPIFMAPQQLECLYFHFNNFLFGGGGSFEIDFFFFFNEKEKRVHVVPPLCVPFAVCTLLCVFLTWKSCQRH